MINRFKWLEVEPMTRQRLVSYLNSIDGFSPVVKTGLVEVAGNRVVCDGFTDQDLCNITPELLRAALDEKTFGSCGVNKDDIYSMFYELVRRMQLPPVVLSEKKEVSAAAPTAEEIDSAVKVLNSLKKEEPSAPVDEKGPEVVKENAKKTNVKK